MKYQYDSILVDPLDNIICYQKITNDNKLREFISNKIDLIRLIV